MRMEYYALHIFQELCVLMIVSQSGIAEDYAVFGIDPYGKSTLITPPSLSITHKHTHSSRRSVISSNHCLTPVFCSVLLEGNSCGEGANLLFRRQ